ncbi:MAG: hypothetical protein ACKERG_02450 [Candidatus Hodgkinia cicadicola]
MLLIEKTSQTDRYTTASGIRLEAVSAHNNLLSFLLHFTSLVIRIVLFQAETSL